MLGSSDKAPTNGARLRSLSAGGQGWTIEELEAEADALRRESDCLPKGNLDALRLHLEKLKVLADAINHRLDNRTLSAGTP